MALRIGGQGASSKDIAETNRQRRYTKTGILGIIGVGAVALGVHQAIALNTFRSSIAYAHIPCNPEAQATAVLRSGDVVPYDVGEERTNTCVANPEGVTIYPEGPQAPFWYNTTKNLYRQFTRSEARRNLARAFADLD